MEPSDSPQDRYIGGGGSHACSGKVRILDEKEQDFGRAAKEFADDLVYGKDVRVETIGADKYGRTIGYVVADSTPQCITFNLVWPACGRPRWAFEIRVFFWACD